MRHCAALITVALAAALVAMPETGIAQGWTSVTTGRGAVVTGNGQVVSQQRPVGNFRQIEARGASEVIVRVGPAPSLAVTADSNIIGLIGGEVRGSRLIIDSRGSYRTRNPVRIVVTVPRLDSMALSGSGNGRIEAITGSSIALAVSGSGNLRASGRARNLAVAVSGSGNIDARALPADTASVVVSGSGNAEVSVERALTSVINGSGNVRYRGRAAVVSNIDNGSGRVIKID